jgi:endoglucanase
MLGAHADEIGFLVTHVTPAGFLRFTKLGFPTEMVLPGQHVRVLSTHGALEGTIGVKPGHILSGDEARRVPPVEKLYIDIGATSSAEVRAWGVEPGTPVCFHGPLAPTRNPQRVIGKAIDNRAGVLALLETAERLAQTPLSATLVFCVAVEEEVGLRGAEVAARQVRPDVFLAIDTVPADGTPDLAPGELPWEIGAGPLLKVRETRGLSTHRPLREFLRRVAEERGIPYQWVVDTAGVTDATSAQQATGGVAAGVLGIPRRYSHSAAEMLDLRDLEHLIQWLCAALPELKRRDQLRRL